LITSTPSRVDALIARAQEPRLDVAQQRGGADVEAQVHALRNLVDVLAAGALRAGLR